MSRELWKKAFIRKQIKPKINLYLDNIIHCDNPVYCNAKILYHIAAFDNDNTIPNDIDKLICETEGMNNALLQMKNDVMQDKVFQPDILNKIEYEFYTGYNNRGMMGYYGIDEQDIKRLVEVYIYKMIYDKKYKDIFDSKIMLFNLQDDNICNFLRWQYLAFIINHNVDDKSYKDHIIHAIPAADDNGNLNETFIDGEAWAESFSFKQLL